MEPPPSDEQIVTFAKMLGSYVGEVFRRNHGADWGMVDIDGDPIAGLRAVKSAILFWPWDKSEEAPCQRRRGQCLAT